MGRSRGGVVGIHKTTPPRRFAPLARCVAAHRAFAGSDGLEAHPSKPRLTLVRGGESVELSPLEKQPEVIVFFGSWLSR